MDDGGIQGADPSWSRCKEQVSARGEAQDVRSAIGSGIVVRTSLWREKGLLACIFGTAEHGVSGSWEPGSWFCSVLPVLQGKKLYVTIPLCFLEEGRGYVTEFCNEAWHSYRDLGRGARAGWPGGELRVCEGTLHRCFEEPSNRDREPRRTGHRRASRDNAQHCWRLPRQTASAVPAVDSTT